MKKLTRRSLASYVAQESTLSKAKAYEVVGSVLEGISLVLGEGGRVELRNFGTFEVIERKARKIVIPGQGAVQVGRRPDVSFQPGKRLRERIEEVEDE